jgi:hypothetical protein
MVAPAYPPLVSFYQRDPLLRRLFRPHASELWRCFFGGENFLGLRQGNGKATPAPFAFVLMVFECREMGESSSTSARLTKRIHVLNVSTLTVPLVI